MINQNAAFSGLVSAISAFFPLTLTFSWPFFPHLGCHKTDEPAAAAQEGANHQRDSGDEGKQEPKHSQLPGQVSQHVDCSFVWTHRWLPLKGFFNAIHLDFSFFFLLKRLKKEDFFH